MTIAEAKAKASELNNPAVNRVLEYDKLDLFPEMLVVAGEFDPIKDEIELFSKKINGKYICFESNTHGFLRNIHTMKDDIYNIIKDFIEER